MSSSDEAVRDKSPLKSAGASTDDIDRILSGASSKPRTPKSSSSSDEEFELIDEPIKAKRGRGGGRGSRGRGRGGRGGKVFEPDPAWRLPFDKGWRREIVYRGSISDLEPGEKRPAADVYYFAPEGKKLRSKVEIESWLEKTGSVLNISSFTFHKDTVYEAPMEQVREANAKRGKPPGSSPKNMKIKTEPGLKIKKEKKWEGPDAKRFKSDSSVSKKDSFPKKDSSSSFSKSSSSSSSKEHSSKSSSSSLSKDHSSKQSSSSSRDHSSSKSSSSASSSFPKKDSSSSGSTSKTSSMLTSLFSPQKVSSDKPSSSSSSVPSKDATPAPVRRAVAKKHTGSLSKKKMYAIQKPPQPNAESTLNRPRPATNRKMCDLNCDGNEGMVPSMQCKDCRCMYHPLCAGWDPTTSKDQFQCSECRTRPSPPPQREATPDVRRDSLVANVKANLPGAIVRPTIHAKPTTYRSILAPGPVKLNLPRINANSLTGQLLTLPQGVADKLKLNENVTLRVGGKNFIVPPSCLVNTPEGVKVLLPAGSLPTQTIDNSQTGILNLNVLANGGPQVVSVSDPNSPPKKPVANVDTWSNKRRQKKKGAALSELCFIQKLHGGADCMIYIFSYLNVAELLTAGKVCRSWYRITQERSLWKTVWMKGCKVSDWAACADTLQTCRTRSLNLSGMDFPADKERMWQQFICSLDQMTRLQKIEFDYCPGVALHAVADKLTNLTDVMAFKIVDNPNDTKKQTDAKVDMGKFKSCTQLKSLKLRGTHGLSLPAYCFSGGLTELANLTELTSLCLGTLHNVPNHEFTFLDALKNLKELELGDCDSWTPDTYTRIGKLENLTVLGLEGGGIIDDEELGTSLGKLKNLEKLELTKWKISESVAKNLPKLERLCSLTISPDAESVNVLAKANTNAYKAIIHMQRLNEIVWGILLDPGRAGTDDERIDQVPVMELEDGEDRPGAPQFLTMNALGDKIRSHLTEPKLKIYKIHAKR